MKRIVFLSLLIVLSSNALYGMQKGFSRSNKYELKNKITKLLASDDDLSQLTDDSPLLEYHLYTDEDLAHFLPQLLAKKANPNVNNKDGRAALDLAINALNLQSALILLHAGADPNKEEHIHTAINHGSRDLVSALLSFGANPNKICVKTCNVTPLTTAIQDGMVSLTLTKNRIAIVTLLLRYGANPTITDTAQKDTLTYMKDYFLYKDPFWNPAKRNPFIYKKIGRALVQYKILFNTLYRNQCWPAETVMNILRFVDYGLDENSDSGKS